MLGTLQHPPWGVPPEGGSASTDPIIPLITPLGSGVPEEEGGGYRQLVPRARLQSPGTAHCTDDA